MSELHGYLIMKSDEELDHVFVVTSILNDYSKSVVVIFNKVSHLADLLFHIL